jgi:hypothetical protein
MTMSPFGIRHRLRSRQVVEQLSPAGRGRVPGRNGSDGEWPAQSQIRIVVHHRQVLCRIMRPIDAVTHVGTLCDGLKPVQEARGHVEVAQLDIVESERLGLTECGRIRPDVDQDIVHSTAGAPHQLGFSAIGAAVHAAHDTARGSGLRILNEGRRRTADAYRLVEDLGVEGPAEEPTLVVKRLRDEEQYIRKVGRPYTHDGHLLTPEAGMIGKGE